MKRARTTLITAVAIGLLAGSAAGVAAQDEAPSIGSAGCDEPLVEPGVYEGINDVDEVTQAYRVVVLQDYADRAPASLILRLSSGGGSLATNFEWWRIA